MSRRIQPAVAGRNVGAQLRELRVRRKLSLREVAAELDWPQSRLSRLEHGRQQVRTEEAAALLVVYRVTGDERAALLRQVERAAEPGWWEAAVGLSAESRTLIHLEAEATTIIGCEPLLVPGLLQTPDYTRAVMESCGVRKVDTQPRIAARLARQAILTRDTPPALHALIDEAALRRPVGGPQVMARQLRHLVSASERPNITLRVVPLAAGAHTGLDGAFALLDFPRNRSVVYLDHKLTGLFLEERHQVEFFRREAVRLAEAALSPIASVNFITRVAGEYERK
ncbi:helix-turn-helix domain-containing protein [Micromonospora sp. NPDC004704]